MSNVLSDDNKQQVLALGRLGWSLRRIEEATRVRRETASGYLKAAGVAVRGRGGRPREWPPKPATTGGVSTDPEPPKPAIPSTNPGRAQWPAAPGRAPSASACDPFRDRRSSSFIPWMPVIQDGAGLKRLLEYAHSVRTDAHQVGTTPATPD